VPLPQVSENPWSKNLARRRQFATGKLLKNDSAAIFAEVCKWRWTSSLKKKNSLPVLKKMKGRAGSGKGKDEGGGKGEWFGMSV